ncbi:6427_t:CDS:10 [Ambispora leptoticha]|uniref:6427_t:CDS:1 n=1 Tax=Ambispora leptoticha TaxID=144679 RepID=A0A9N8ZMQ0_9GLOM|nr:6427_t:CDS:10 [Ambispora leptoticha]
MEETELGQNQKLVTTEEFDFLGSTEREKAQKQALTASIKESRSGFSVISERLIEDLIVPSKEPVGAREIVEEDGVAPRSGHWTSYSAIIKFDHKVNTYGLGFDPYKNAPEFASKVKSNSKVEQSHFKTASSLPMKGGIGVGALEDEDDEDIYDTTSIRDYQTLLIDEDEEAIFVGRKQDKKPQTFVSSKKISSLRLCYDGSEPLAGFVLARRPLPLNKWQLNTRDAHKLIRFTPPGIPTGFVPIHYFDTPGPAETQKTMPSETSQKVTTLAIIADQRAAKLGENPLQAPARSVFDFVSRRDKERLSNLIEAHIEIKTEYTVPPKFVIPKVEKDVAMAALRGFIPFGDNLPKQTRYKQFLEYQAGLSQVELRLPEDYTVDEFSKELDDFAKAARIFRPMSSMIASRFASASPSSIIQEFKQPEGGLRAPSSKKSSQEISTTLSTTTSTTVVEDSRSAAEAAAKMNMFGALTRTRTEFYPNRLLCKRFNIANPHPEHKSDSSTGKTQKGQQQPLSKEKMDEIMQERSTELFVNNPNNSSAPTFTQTITQSESLQKKVSEESKLDSENKETVAIDYVRPSMDIFKAIFESESDSESEQETSNKKVPPNLVSHSIDVPKPDEPISTQVTSIVSVSSSSPIIKQEKSETSFRPMFIPKSDRAHDRTLLSSTSSHFKSSEAAPNTKKDDHISTTTGPLSFLDDIPQTEPNRKRSFSSRDESKTTNAKEEKYISSSVKETKSTTENIADDSTRHHEELRISHQHISKKQKRDDSDDEYARRRHKDHKKSTSSKQRSSASKKHKKQDDSDSNYSQTGSSESSSSEIVHRRHKVRSKRHKKERSSSKKKSKKRSGKHKDINDNKSNHRTKNYHKEEKKRMAEEEPKYYVERQKSDEHVRDSGSSSSAITRVSKLHRPRAMDYWD